MTEISYKLVDVINFIDQIYDLGAMCYNEKANGFTPHGKAWFKAKMHSYLKRQAEPI